MTTYKVYEVEDKVSVKGNSYKKLVLQEPSSQYPLKNVTMFANHPLFEEIAPGQIIEFDIETKDSDTPNPHGGFYKNRIVLNPSQSAKPIPQSKGITVTNGAPQSATADIRIMNALTLKVIPMLENMRKDQMAILEKMKMHNPYPEMNESNDAYYFLDDNEVTKEDLPF